MSQQLQYAQMLIVLVRGRAERARREGRSEVGASAIEWAIISAIVVTLALGIYTVISNVVESRTNEIQDGVNGG
ncbi:hypothetical protein [Solicola sp. PLA-1-18]|uniref:hypothetical protein n=1 Tax=Solicola sp. PLA-1-18 TaxID=3380532 RepID=UPI003B79E4A6